ncbi:short-chain fatty acyl-CoA regulator family protein [Thalassococcus sp. BH17M4-6]|uniref:short-chain fatty acyl-CoA regulator family protein n=1 Tax=Thalassococcus sp. BH17M4-6 TaxID=3413148 RepID=UPI003BD1A66F
MARDTLTGSRIRERRIMAGIKQADLARMAQISPSYLNLIEHNRRRIGGKLLLDIATLLEVEPQILTEGAEATLIASLREAASDLRGHAAELDRVDEFAGRFPGWAALLEQSRRRIDALERTVESLSDRMTHDPHLAASLHEMLSTVTAIQSAATILAEPGEIEPEWQQRFHRNIFEDSARLADTSRSLVTYLEAADDGGAEVTVPQEEVDGILDAQDHHFPQLETGDDSPDALADRLGAEVSDVARALLRRVLRRYAEDAARLPLDVLDAALTAAGADPLQLADAVGMDAGLVMRRLAALPLGRLSAPVALAICDASGTLIYRKPLPDFAMPRFGAACPLWPLYRALSRPMTVLYERVAQPGHDAGGLSAWAVAQPMGTPRVNRDPIYEAQMLVQATGAGDRDDPAPVGVTCRICPRLQCAARREPSILGGPA